MTVSGLPPGYRQGCFRGVWRLISNNEVCVGHATLRLRTYFVLLDTIGDVFGRMFLERPSRSTSLWSKIAAGGGRVPFSRADYCPKPQVFCRKLQSETLSGGQGRVERRLVFGDHVRVATSTPLNGGTGRP